MLARTRARARHAPRDASARTITSILDDAGLLETGARAAPSPEAEAERAYAARRALVRRHGARALGALRAAALVAFEERFDCAGAHGDARRFGAFHLALAQRGAIREGRCVAPALVVRTLYAARWNVVLHLPPTSGFERAERHAYYGWLALHVPGVPREARLDALARFGDAGGGRVALETAAYLLFDEHAFPSAERTYAELASAHDDLRARNHALAARVLSTRE